MRPEHVALARVRALIDRADDALLLLFAARRGLVRAAARLKREAGLPARDPAREAHVHARAQALGARLALSPDSVRGLVELLIADGCRLQGLGSDLDQGASMPVSRTILASRAPPPAFDFVPLPSPHARLPSTVLPRWLPPPARLAPALQLFPYRLQCRLLEAVMQRVLAGPLAEGALDFLRGRRLGIEVSDLQLRWVVSLHDGRLHTCARGEEAEATVRGSATDLLLLASRLEDADTLFFQRRLVLTGDTELGLTTRNTLDRLPWERVPLGLRIALNRLARFARAARAAHRGEAPPA
ncbi:ubiquinone anaerobic biosynthesis accessory factor UbiT [Rehaibacterium terrae]|uniref:Ubiquinone biosynthesis accessory factor UbiT n=1 Tax=Rehaibacterium terrae TaxID=1341696 RepID=A0A7W8DFD5_9GAMM|nr:SCP2 sterol-binding domain-containing protein [Rehaibacterium terrae]MBB5016412.1 putative lipid carrier protein YhbT/chorismate mutase [Rehaibacterium terrae]